MVSDPLDRIDRELLHRLSNDARASNKELAAAVGLAPSSCHVRVQRLVREGWVQGFHAEVRPEAFGIGIRAIVFVRMARHTTALLDDFREHVEGLVEAIDVFYVAGSHDFLVHVAVRDVDHLRRLVAERISSHDATGHVETSLIFEHRHRAAWPDYLESGLGSSPQREGEGEGEGEPAQRRAASAGARKRSRGVARGRR